MTCPSRAAMSGLRRRDGWHEGRVRARRTLGAGDAAPGGRACRLRRGRRGGAGRGPAFWRFGRRQVDVLAAYVAAGGSVQDAAELVGIRASTVKRHLADLRARSGLTTEQLIYSSRALGRLVVPSLEPA